MYKSNIHIFDDDDNVTKHLLMTLIPVTMVSTPCGQWLQDKVPSSWIRIILGIVITAVVSWKIISSFLDDHNKAKEQQQQQETKPETEIYPTTEEKIPLLNDANNNNNNNIDDDESITTTTIKENNKDLLRVGGFSSSSSKSTIFVWGTVLGFFSGFLGGLIGMRGPPLMLFFLQFPFPKADVRSVGAVMLFLNMVLRIVFYISYDLYHHQHDNDNDNDNDNANNNNNDNDNDNTTPLWFLWSSSWRLYIGVIVAGIIGIPIGDWIHHYIDQNKFQFVLAILLAASGILNITKGISDFYP